LVVVGDAHPTILNLPHMKSEKECYRYNKSSRAFTDRATLIAMSNEQVASSCKKNAPFALYKGDVADAALL